eukprot:300686-Pyramimonas_sp.AAC.1
MQVETIDEDAAESDSFTAFVVIVTVMTIIYPSISYVKAACEQGEEVSFKLREIKEYSFKLRERYRNHGQKRKQAS